MQTTNMLLVDDQLAQLKSLGLFMTIFEVKAMLREEKEKASISSIV